MIIKKKSVIVFLGLFFILIAVITLRFIGYVTVVDVSSSVSVTAPIYVKYDNFDGQTTNFSDLSDAQLGSIGNLILEITQYGRIIFYQTIDLASDARGNVIDLDSNVNISSNRIQINVGQLPSLNKQATLYIKNLSYDNPRILKDGSVCSVVNCQILDYSGGTIVFVVSQLGNSVYSVQETPEPSYEAPDEDFDIEDLPRGFGGSSSAVPTEIRYVPITGGLPFMLNKNLIKVSITQGEVKRETLQIASTAKSAIHISLKPLYVDNFMVIDEDSFILSAGSSKTINIDFFAREKEIPDSYTGKIIIDAEGIVKIINVIVDVKLKEPYFEIYNHVKEKHLMPGNKVVSNIRIVNLRDLKDINTTLYYSIENFDGEVLISREENFSIKDEKEINFDKEFEIFESIPIGDYSFYASISYNNITTATRDDFKIVEPEAFELSTLGYRNTFILILIAFIILLMISWLYKKWRNRL